MCQPYVWVPYVLHMSAKTVTKSEKIGLLSHVSIANAEFITRNLIAIFFMRIILQFLKKNIDPLAL